MDKLVSLCKRRGFVYQSSEIYGGLNGNPGTRSLQGSHPYWLGHDRVMADEFFRPYFTNGVWAAGEPIKGLWYTFMLGNNLSALGITAKQLTRWKYRVVAAFYFNSFLFRPGRVFRILWNFLRGKETSKMESFLQETLRKLRLRKGRPDSPGPVVAPSAPLARTG